MNKQGKDMKRIPTYVLRAAIIAIGAVILAICAFALPPAWMAVADEYPSHTYVFYVILTALYVAAIPFFVALYQAMRLLKYIDTGKAFSMLSVKALRRIAVCALIISVIFIANLPFMYIWADNDDAPGLVLVGTFFVVAPFVIAVFSGVLQRLFREAIEIKKENDLTV